MRRILIAGIGNIFHGDDAFGVEVAQALMQRAWPEAVQVAELGIRSYDLAYALMDEYDAAILVDATQQGGAPGTLYLIEPDLGELEAPEGTVVNGHSMNPVRALQLVETLGGEPPPLYLVGCEPAVLKAEDGRIGLSETVQAIVPEAIEMIDTLVDDLLGENPPIEPQPAKTTTT